MFQPLFPWSSAWTPEFGKPNQLEQIADDLLETDPIKEALLRSFMSSIELREATTLKESAIRSIVDDLTQLCAPLLELQHQNRHSAFQQDLRKYLLNVLEAWEHAQKSQFRPIATITYTRGDEWGERDSHDSLTSETLQDPTEVPVATLFPRVYCLVGAASRKIIHPGTVLWSSQTIYVSGKKEYNAQYRRISNRNSGEVRGTGRRRRQSNAQ
jgi:hypothetical protein